MPKEKSNNGCCTLYEKKKKKKTNILMEKKKNYIPVTKKYCTQKVLLFSNSQVGGFVGF